MRYGQVRRRAKLVSASEGDRYLMACPRILFVSPSAYPLGGVADWLDYLLPGLQDEGWECVLGLVAGLHHAADFYAERHPWQEVKRIQNPTGSPEGRILALTRVIKENQPDILVVVNIVDAYEAVRRLKLAGKPCPKVVTALHGLQGDLLADLKAEADVIDAVIATNKLAALLAGEAIRSDARSYYAPCGVSIENADGFAHHKTERTFRLLYSGRLDQGQKRIFDLPALMAILREMDVKARIDLAGSGPDESELRKQFNALGLQGDVSFLGHLNSLELTKAYRDHDALIITSVWETGPIVAWEAMSHCLPVLSSRFVGSGKEGALEDEVNCLLYPVGDMQAAANAVVKLLQPGLRDQLIQGGRSLVMRRYSRSASVMEWNHALRKILELPGKAMPSSTLVRFPSGRLDKWFGIRWGEWTRRLLGFSYQHQAPGGEWPHTRHASDRQEDFLLRARELDIAS